MRSMSISFVTSLSLSFSSIYHHADAHTGFSVATYDWSAATNTSDVVTDGLVMPLWMGDDQTGQFNLIDAATNQATFYLWVTQGSAQAYNIVSTVGDANLLAISVDQQFGLARPVNQGFQTAKFTVTFTCGQSNGFGFVSLSVSVDPFDPFTIAWFKNCQGAVVPGGMSATGVFFLTVFLLTLFGCMGGCAFKYVKLHARGVEVIPGIDTWRGLYARCKNGGGAAPGYDGVVYKSSVGPQSQFDAPIQDQHAATAGASSASSSNPFGSYQNI